MGKTSPSLLEPLMEWENFRRSDNIEDRREDGSFDPGSGGGGGGFGGAGGLGLGTIVVLGLIGWYFGVDPRILINGAQTINNVRHGGQTQPAQPQREAQTGRPKDNLGDFVAAVLGETEDTWSRVLPEQKGIRYQPVKLVLFRGATTSGCGDARSQMGPFYCPSDKKVYLDLSFFQEMKNKLGGGGDFAYAYVIAHELGHHVQDQLGILGKVQSAERQSGKVERNALSVKVELMADCLAGVWAANANKQKNFLRDGDVEKAINTATAIGDDRLQQAARGYSMPDSFTHGSAGQRVKWLKIGLQSGQVDSCNTFARE